MIEKDGSFYVPWECEWKAVGPFPSNTLRLRKITELPDMGRIPKTIPGTSQKTRIRDCFSRKGFLDFKEMFGQNEGCPIGVLFTEIESKSPENIIISYAADWTSRWWLNGELIYDASNGHAPGANDISADNPFARQFILSLHKGINLVALEVGSGFVGWNIRILLGRNLRESAITPSLCLPKDKLPYVPGRSTRDYSSTGLRLENRNGAGVPGIERRALEVIARKSGIEGRWIQVVDSRNDIHGHHALLGSPFFPSKYLTPSPVASKSAGRRLRQWVKAIQNEGMPAISWYPMCFSTEAVLEHPDWASRPLVGEENRKGGAEIGHACINSPYGEALIDFAIEAIRDIGLDGFFFDGAYFVPKQWVGCACRYCRHKFRQQEGLEIPKSVDWSDEAFRKWVKWRYKTFTEFWGRLAGRIQRTHPHARVVINHTMPRGDSSWLCACPLNPTDIDIIGATEASSIDVTSSFTTRLVRAYGYKETEVWMSLGSLHTNIVKDNPAVYIHHALSCMTAGGIPSFGSDDNADLNAHAYRQLGAIINPRREWVGVNSVPYAALHVSEQSQTFFFSRRKDNSLPLDYWQSVLGWNNLLTEMQCLTDIVFDVHLKPSFLARYPILIMPLSLAISNQQLDIIEEYVRDGGILVAGPWFGSCDEWGEKADPERVLPLLGKIATTPPKPENYNALDHQVFLRTLGKGKVLQLCGDVGQYFHASYSRRLSLRIGHMLKNLAVPAIKMLETPNIHVGLFQRNGELILHVQNTCGYSSINKVFPNPIFQVPPPQKNLSIEINGFPVQAVDQVAGETRGRIKFIPRKNHVKITIPDLQWGTVLRLRI